MVRQSPGDRKLCGDGLYFFQGPNSVLAESPVSGTLRLPRCFSSQPSQDNMNIVEHM